MIILRYQNTGKKRKNEATTPTIIPSVFSEFTNLPQFPFDISSPKIYKFLSLKL